MSAALHDLKEGELYSGHINETRYLAFEKKSELKHEFFDRVVQARIGSDE